MTEQEYRNGKRIAVRCENGHSSTRAINSIVKGHGCRSCHARIGESLVRAAFERLFRCEFPLRRPRWLRTTRGGRLELDGYNEELRLAFEYQGFTHYSHANPFGEAFVSVVRRDAEKAARCAERGVTLIHIHEMPQETLYNAQAVLGVVRQSLEQHGIRPFATDSITLPPAQRTVDRLKRLRLVGTNLGIELLDDEYKGVDHRYAWRCMFCSRTFVGNAYYRFIGRGCPLCWRKRRAEGTLWVSLKSRPVYARE